MKYIANTGHATQWQEEDTVAKKIGILSEAAAKRIDRPELSRPAQAGDRVEYVEGRGGKVADDVRRDGEWLADTISIGEHGIIPQE